MALAALSIGTGGLVGTVEEVIGYLEGVVRKGCVVTSGGVGYFIHTPDELEVGSSVELWVETVVRQDAIVLYGFLDESGRDLFRALCKVTGVGPVAALALLRQIVWPGCWRRWQLRTRVR